MASNSFKVKNSLVLTPKDLATLVSPEAGDLACDINDSNKIKRYDVNSASWVEVGSGGGVGGTDIFFVQDFESASLASFTQTGLTLSQTDPLHGKVSALLTHQAGVSPTNDQKFKQVIPVDRKFRGESMTLRLNCKSSASAGNVTINIYDETNAANIVASEQLQLANDVSGAISQVGFTIPATCASISYTITALPQSGSPVTRIDDVIAELAVTSLLETVVELTGNAQTLTIPLTQSGLVQEADSQLFAAGNAGQVITTSVTNIPFIAVSSIGSDISWNGTQFTPQVDGIYSITGSVIYTAAATRRIEIYANGVLVKSIGDTTAATSTIVKFDLTERFTAGQIISFRVDSNGGTLVNNAAYHYLNIARQGSLKQVSVSPDQKITIPTSELRFEGASSRGTSPSNAIVKFDTLAKLRGDAFTVNNDPVLGTSIIMKKAGKLNVSCTLYKNAAFSYFISKNQAVLTTISTGSETLSAASFNGVRGSASFDGTVNVGDVIRVCADSAPTADSYQSLNLSFQEQDISVSVTNTLPQFSESDSSVRVDTANGYGSFGTKIRRFSSVRDSIGVDVEYLDSATNGASFTVKSAGVYDISYSDDANAATVVGLSKNAPDLTLALSSLASINRLAISDIYTANARTCVSWQGYLAVGDVIRAHTQGIPSSNAAFASFTMSKVGKPNVTGVNVTPFVNVPQPENQSMEATGGVTSSASIAIPTLNLVQKGSGLFSYNTSTGVFTVLKKMQIGASFTFRAPSAITTLGVFRVNSGDKSAGSTPNLTGTYETINYDGELNVGDTFDFYMYTATDNTRVFISATALSDQILTAPETFSTDTAPLTYANAATYTLSTLANAPVGTYITFTYAANTNTRTQTTLTNRPTQTDADMNANGMLVYTRAYNAPSTAGNPAAFAIQIGKGLKGVSQNLYKAAAKTTAGNLDHVITSAAGRLGANIKDYDEKTGVLFVDTGIHAVSSNTVAELIFSDGTLATSGYLVINASKNPALTGIGLNRVAARGVNTSGPSIPNTGTTTLTYNATKTYDTNGALNTATGVFTAPESGFYTVSASVLFSSAVYGIPNYIQLVLNRNGALYSYLALTTIQTATSISAGTGGTETIQLNRGDTVSIGVINNRNAGATSIDVAAGYTKFSIVKTSV